jgi:GT2 family glycosyltransferase
MPAVIGACLMIRKTVFQAVGGFDEALVVMWSDTDLCFKARQQGLMNLYTPYAQLCHYEGVSHTAAPDQMARDWARFRARWRGTEGVNRET